MEVLVLNKPNVNNRTYPIEVMKKAVEEYKNKFIPDKSFLYLYDETNPCEPTLDNVIGLIGDVYIENDKLAIKFKFMTGLPTYKQFLKSFEGKIVEFKITPVGVASLKDNVIQDDYQLESFSIYSEKYDK